MVFDLDGTLTHTTGVDDACFLEALRQALGIERVDSDWSKYPHATDSGLTREVIRMHLAREATEDDLRSVHDRFVSLLHEQAAAAPRRFAQVPGAAGMVEAVRSRPGWSMALATGAWRASAMLKLRTAGLDLGGAPGAYADDDQCRKRIVITAVSRALGHSPPPAGAEQQTVALARARFGGIAYVGDGVWDARASRDLGIGFVGVRVEGDFERLSAEGAWSLIRGYADPGAALAAMESQARSPAWR